MHLRHRLQTFLISTDETRTWLARRSAKQAVRTTTLQCTLISRALLDALNERRDIWQLVGHAAARQRRLHGKAHLDVRRTELTADEPTRGSQLLVDITQVQRELRVDERRLQGVGDLFCDGFGEE